MSTGIDSALTLQALAAGLIAGFAVAVPLGPVGLLIVERSARYGLQPGLAAAAGVATADLLYAALAAVAAAPLTPILTRVAIPLRGVSAAVLVTIAIAGMIRSAHSAGAGPGQPTLSSRRLYFGLLGLTLLNPARCHPEPGGQASPR